MTQARLIGILLLAGIACAQPAQPKDDRKRAELEKKLAEATAALSSGRDRLRASYKALEALVHDATIDAGAAWSAEAARVLGPVFAEVRSLVDRPGTVARQKAMQTFRTKLRPAMEGFSSAGLVRLAPYLEGRCLEWAASDETLGTAMKSDDAALVQKILEPVIRGEIPFAKRWNDLLSDHVAEAREFRDLNRAVADAQLDLEILKDPVLAFRSGAPAGFARVPAGSYVLRTTAGAPNIPGRKKERQFSIREVFLGINEVTQGEYFEWLSTLPKEEVTRRQPKDDRGTALWVTAVDTNLPTPLPDAMSLPVVGVSFENATLYAKARGARLPTEEEWCAMAGGKDGRMWPWGQEYAKGKANDHQAEKGVLAPVGSFAAGRGPFGHHDVSGNAREWVATYENGKPVLEEKIEDANVLVRGGSFQGVAEDVSNGWVWIKRAYFDQDLQTGFRLARDP